MAKAYSRIGYGRLRRNNMAEDIVDQTGYGTKVVINPETIVPGDNDFNYEVADRGNLAGGQRPDGVKKLQRFKESRQIIDPRNPQPIQ